MLGGNATIAISARNGVELLQELSWRLTNSIKLFSGMLSRKDRSRLISSSGDAREVATRGVTEE